MGKNLAGQLNYMGFFSFMYSERSVISGEDTEFPPQLPEGLMSKHDAPDGQHPSLKFWFTPEALQQQVRRRLIFRLKFSLPFIPRAKIGPCHSLSPFLHGLGGTLMGGKSGDESPFGRVIVLATRSQCGGMLQTFVCLGIQTSTYQVLSIVPTITCTCFV